MDVTDKQIRRKSAAVKPDAKEEKVRPFEIRSREDARRMVVFSELLKPKYDEI